MKEITTHKRYITTFSSSPSISSITQQRQREYSLITRLGSEVLLELTRNKQGSCTTMKITYDSTSLPLKEDTEDFDPEDTVFMKLVLYDKENQTYQVVRRVWKTPIQIMDNCSTMMKAKFEVTAVPNHLQNDGTTRLAFIMAMGNTPDTAVDLCFLPWDVLP
jgi:hypothetical protein